MSGLGKGNSKSLWYVDSAGQQTKNQGWEAKCVMSSAETEGNVHYSAPVQKPSGFQLQGDLL